MKRVLLWTAGCLVGIWVLCTVALYAAMRQSPDRFGAIMTRIPAQAMMVLPFKPLWMHARRGPLAVGDAAPDFELPSVDRSRLVRLSDELRKKPVVLIFGSYT